MDEKPAKKPFSDRRWREGPGFVNPICSDCKWRRLGLNDKGKVVCAAFPEEIPRNILITCYGERDITKECANGYKFEPIE